MATETKTADPNSALNEARGQMDTVASEIRNAFEIPSLASMWRWCMTISGWLNYIKVQEVKAESTYKMRRRDIRIVCKSVADTDLIAEATEEYRLWREWRGLHEDTLEILKSIKRFVDAMTEERRNIE